MAAFYDKQKNIDTMVATWRAAGWSNEAIAGMLGRMDRESSFNTGIVNPNDAGPGKDSFGGFQWNRERREALNRFAQEQGTKPSDPATQAKFVVWETQNTEKQTGKRLNDVGSVDEAVNAAMLYTRPKGSVKKVDGKWVNTPTEGLHYNETRDAAARYYAMITGKEYVPTAAEPTAYAQAEANQTTATPNTETVKADTEKKTPFGIKIPDKVMGIDTKSALGGLSKFAELSQQSADAFNAARPKGGLLATAQPSPLWQANQTTPVTGHLLGGPMAANQTGPANSQEEEKKRLLAMLGGLGQFGGLGGFA